MKEYVLAFNSVIKDKVNSIDKMYSNQNNVFLINNKYILKVYSIDSIKNEKDLNIRKEQLRISKIWNENGINTILPITDIFKYEDHYYIIYPYIDGKVYDEGDLNIYQIRSLAKMQAMIHKLNIDTKLPNHNEHINLKYKDLTNFINKCNESIKVSKNNECICNNDFKPLNIIWKNNSPYLIDFDAVSKNNRAFSLLESAYTFTHKGNKIDIDLYKEYIRVYKKEYKNDILNIDEAIYGSWNGKLKWVQYLFDKGNKDYMDLINQMIEYEKYEKIIKEIVKFN